MPSALMGRKFFTAGGVALYRKCMMKRKLFLISILTLFILATGNPLYLTRLAAQQQETIRQQQTELDRLQQQVLSLSGLSAWIIRVRRFAGDEVVAGPHVSTDRASAESLSAKPANEV